MFGDLYLKLVHALQNPQLAVFVVLEQHPVALPLFAPANWEGLSLDWYEHEFTMKRNAYMFSAAEDFPRGPDMPQFLHGAVYLGRGRVACDGDWLSCEQAQHILGLDGFPDPVGEIGPDGLPDSNDLIKLWSDDEWLKYFLLGEDTGAHEGSPAGERMEATKGDACDHVASVLEAFEEARMDLTIDPGETHVSMSELFTWGHKTGEYESWNSGDLFELIKIEANAPLRDWLRRHLLPRSQSFGVSQYPFRHIQMMIEYYCHRMRFFYIQSLDKGA